MPEKIGPPGSQLQQDHLRRQFSRFGHAGTQYTLLCGPERPDCTSHSQQDLVLSAWHKHACSQEWGAAGFSIQALPDGVISEAGLNCFLLMDLKDLPLFWIKPMPSAQDTDVQKAKNLLLSSLSLACFSMFFLKSMIFFFAIQKFRQNAKSTLSVISFMIYTAFPFVKIKRLAGQWWCNL